MKKFQYSALVATLLVGMASSAMAADGGFYAAIDLGQSDQSNGCAGITAGVTCTKTDTAVRGAVGYQFSQNIAFEASYGDYGAAKASNGVVSAKQAASGLQLAVVGTMPLTKEFALTGKLGIANTTMKLSGAVGGWTANLGSQSSTTLAYGIGAQYSFTPAIALRAQYEGLGQVTEVGGGTKTGLSLLSAGLVFSF
ncbi:MAG: outer membrane beta-barrel protein [Gallionella sp.]|nr:outer membrane beta-barrel protein [Gallionella sp.]